MTQICRKSQTCRLHHLALLQEKATRCSIIGNLCWAFSAGTFDSPNSFCVFCQRAARITNTQKHAIPTLFIVGGNPPKLLLTIGGYGPPIQYMVTWAHRTPQAKCHLDRASCLLRAHTPLSLYFTVGRPLPRPKIALSHGGIRTPSNIWLLWPTSLHMPNGISIGPAVFAGYIIMTSQTIHGNISSNMPHLCYAYYAA